MAFTDPDMWMASVPGVITPEVRAETGRVVAETQRRRAAAVSALPGVMGVTAMALQPPAPAQAPPILPAIPAAAAAAGIALPAWLLAALGIAGAGYAGYQALGGGEGGGLFGLNILGGDEFQLGGLEFGGPGLPEPTAPYSEWHVGNKQFYYVPVYSDRTGKFLHAKVAMYNRDTKKWKVWTLPKPMLAVIGKNHPSHRMLTRLRHNLRRHTADAKTILQVASPAYYAKMSGYYKRKRR
ncbi:unnamed protein product [marine sediment metagenome]|uniref:Uncharacterized protein n=1 Tax=marine sediment metagenome TaxID=412755 RepID=X1LLJ5_9ZZZZ